MFHFLRVRVATHFPYLYNLQTTSWRHGRCKYRSLRSRQRLIICFSLLKITLWPKHPPIDGYICESVAGRHESPSAILSKYFEKPVHLVFKGPNARLADPTPSFPDLKVTVKIQDMYPLLVLSEESTEMVDAQVQNYIGTQGIDERWREEKVAIERYVLQFNDQPILLWSQLRFRPNIVFKGGGPFAEDRWEEICIGSEGTPSITLVSKCTRCLVSIWDNLEIEVIYRYYYSAAQCPPADWRKR